MGGTDNFATELKAVFWFVQPWYSTFTVVYEKRRGSTQIELEKRKGTPI